MACRADRVDWRDATPSSGIRGPRWSCRGERPWTACALAADAVVRVNAALAPADVGAVSAGILNRLREHHYLPPALPTAAP